MNATHKIIFSASYLTEIKKHYCGPCQKARITLEKISIIIPIKQIGTIAADLPELACQLAKQPKKEVAVSVRKTQRWHLCRTGLGNETNLRNK
jgi:hypothetical protein